MVTPVGRELRFVRPGQLGPAVKHLPASRRVETAEDVQQRRLAASRRAEQDDELGIEQLQVDAP